MAERRGVKRESIVVDPGIGFGKSQEQNVELVAKVDQLVKAFPDFPLLIGTSRKSFIGRILADENGEPAPVTERLHGTMASITGAVLKGAHIVRVHDVSPLRKSFVCWKHSEKQRGPCHPSSIRETFALGCDPTRSVFHTNNMNRREDQFSPPLPCADANSARESDFNLCQNFFVLPPSD